MIQGSKPIGCTTPRVHLQVNYGLWVIMMCPCRFISRNKRPTQVRDVDPGGGCACVGQGVYGRSQLPSPQFSFELKTALKNKAFF